MNKTKLVQIATSDGLYLQGYFAPKEGKTVLLHIHGYAGNFYENKFVQVLAEELDKENLPFLVVNTRGSEKIKDFNTVSGKIQTIGARYELMEEAHLDITAWINFLIKQGYEKVILSGHSLGTMKVTRYLFEGELKEKVEKLILLAPLDIKGQMIANGRPDILSLLKKAQAKVDEGKGSELTTDEFDYEGDVSSYESFISLYRQNDLGRVFDYCTEGYDFPILKQIRIPTKILMGSKDEYFQFKSPEESIKILFKNISDSEGKIIDDATHFFAPHEDILAAEVIEFIKK